MHISLLGRREAPYARVVGSGADSDDMRKVVALELDRNEHRDKDPNNEKRRRVKATRAHYRREFPRAKTAIVHIDTGGAKKNNVPNADRYMILRVARVHLAQRRPLPGRVRPIPVLRQDGRRQSARRVAL